MEGLAYHVFDHLYFVLLAERIVLETNSILRNNPFSKRVQHLTDLLSIAEAVGLQPTHLLRLLLVFKTNPLAIRVMLPFCRLSELSTIATVSVLYVLFSWLDLSLGK